MKTKITKEAHTDEHTITNIDGRPLTIQATRTRDSDGFSTITLQFGEQSIVFASTALEHKYEDAAKRCIGVLAEAVQESCTIQEYK